MGGRAGEAGWGGRSDGSHVQPGIYWVFSVKNIPNSTLKVPLVVYGIKGIV